MKIALIGYGKMGHAVEAEAEKRGHTIALRLDTPLSTLRSPLPADVAIEFTAPVAAAENLRRCLDAGIPVVCGTTGWYAAYDEICALCRQRGGRMLTATNFSVGMNIMFALNRRLAALMRGRTDYTVDLCEVHHIHKLDAPSGTALSLRDQIAECGEREKDDIPIESIREGEVPGTHTVSYRSAVDTITLTHEAHSRQGLAQGAVLAAEWLVAAAPGVYTMNDLLAI